MKCIFVPDILQDSSNKVYNNLREYKKWEFIFMVDRDRSVGLATRYGLDIPGIES